VCSGCQCAPHEERHNLLVIGENERVKVAGLNAAGACQMGRMRLAALCQKSDGLHAAVAQAEVSVAPESVWRDLEAASQVELGAIW